MKPETIFVPSPFPVYPLQKIFLLVHVTLECVTLPNKVFLEFSQDNAPAPAVAVCTVAVCISLRHFLTQV